MCLYVEKTLLLYGMSSIDECVSYSSIHLRMQKDCMRYTVWCSNKERQHHDSELKSSSSLINHHFTSTSIAVKFVLGLPRILSWTHFANDTIRTLHQKSFDA